VKSVPPIEINALEAIHEQPLVSVCIGVYNREQYIRECIDSVLAQTYRNIEIIVADNASTDATKMILQSYPTVRLIELAANSGMCSTTRNAATREAAGKYIAFLDSDDSWYPDKISEQVRFMEQHEHIPLCHTYCRLIDENSVASDIRHEGCLPRTGDCFLDLLDHCWITISSVIIRRELYFEMGPFNETLPYGQSGEDYEFFLKVAREHPVGLIDKVLVNYRKSDASITAGNWRATPHALPFYRELLRRRDIWHGAVPEKQLRDVIGQHAVENSIYWRDRAFYSRSLWSTWNGLQVAPLQGRLWWEGAKTVVKAVIGGKSS
jgi:glycosyltransferase involved in cell wall biosynthesis